MSNHKKRRYHSKLRKTAAQETRSGILRAAKRLFSKQGIEKVTIDDLAAEAGVSSPTIFAIFGSKKGLLLELMNESLFGDRYEKLVQKALSAKDPIERLAMAASIARTIYNSYKSQIGLIQGASAFSPELKQLERAGERMRFRRQEGTIKLLAKHKLLLDGLDVRQARDILWTLTGREIYRMLVLERGWSSDQYEKWLRGELLKALISPAPLRDFYRT